MKSNYDTIDMMYEWTWISYMDGYLTMDVPSYDIQLDGYYEYGYEIYLNMEVPNQGYLTLSNHEIIVI